MRAMLVLGAAALAVLSLPVGAEGIGPVPASVRSEFGIASSWYAKYVDAGGIPVVGSVEVSDRAMLKARGEAITLLRTLPVSVTTTLRAQRNRIVILGLSETVRDIPEYASAFPDTSRDASYWGGFGATLSLPITSGTEANLLRDLNHEDVFVHEFSHSVAEMALVTIDRRFPAERTQAYTHAREMGLWKDTYADDNEAEYWAEGVQSYFGVNRDGPPDGDGVHNHVNTREELEDHDRLLYGLINRIYGPITLHSR